MTPIDAALCALIVHAGLGAFDTFVNHEWREHLPQRPAAATELALHATRSLLFAAIFAGCAWLEWRGAWGWLMLAIMASEFAVTLADSVVEDRTRRLSALERINHMLLALNTGVYMALFGAQMATQWHGMATALVPARHPALLAWALTLASAGVIVWTVRDALASRRLAKTPARGSASYRAEPAR